MIEDIRGPLAVETGTDGVVGIFHFRDDEDRKASAIEGRPVTKRRVYCKMVVPGQPKSTAFERVTDEHRKRWPRAWADFEAQKEGAIDGTPLEIWPPLTVAQVARLRAAGVYTVQMLEAVSDANIQRLGLDGPKLREMARQHLKGPGEEVRDLRKRLSDLEAEVKALKGQNDSLRGAVRLYEERDAARAEDEPATPSAPVIRNGRGKAAAKAAKRVAA